MTHHVIKVLEDGTRVYSNYTRYRPREQRAYEIRKPEDPRAVRWFGEWLLPLDLLADEQREVPETRPDTDAYDHMTKPRKCRCRVCKRPEARKWKALWRKEQRQILTASEASAST